MKTGIQHYSFSIPCDNKGIVVSWAMHDEEASAIEAATKIIQNHQSLLSEENSRDESASQR